jgi:hypothetical protein
MPPAVLRREAQQVVVGFASGMTAAVHRVGHIVPEP